MPQILKSSNLGSIITALSEQSNTIVEIGTFDGLGSTLCVLEAIKLRLNDNKVKFQTIELDSEMYQISLNNLREYLQYDYFKILNGAVTHNHLVIDEFSACFNDLDQLSRDHYYLWHKREVDQLKHARLIKNLLPNTIDLLILDGSEYTTYYEWQELKDRTNLFVLDDTNILKCKRIRSEMISDPNYQMIYDDPNDRNGYSVFSRRVKLVSHS